ncbi:MAG: HAD-IIIA family hydrolase [Clostridia bacterium]|nr:HAD-IIIA family hydrolase [Clostridia bacterium]
MIRCILFDRDGTLGSLGDDRYPATFTPFCPIRPVFEALQARGYTVGILSNQSSIARGTGRGYDFDAEFRSYGADVWRICPHDTADNCNCRKPGSGMLLSVADELAAPLRDCIVVGDRLSDVLCAENVGATGILVLTGKGQQEKEAALAQFPSLTILSRFDEVIPYLDQLEADTTRIP